MRGMRESGGVVVERSGVKESGGKREKRKEKKLGRVEEQQTGLAGTRGWGQRSTCRVTGAGDSAGCGTSQHGVTRPGTGATPATAQHRTA